MLSLHTHASVKGVKSQNIYKILPTKELSQTKISLKNIIVKTNNLNDLECISEAAGFLIDKTDKQYSNYKNKIVISNIRNTSVINSGDVVRLKPNSSSVSVLFRRGANANILFTTERCNHFCVMCSQPPREINDNWRIKEIIKLIKLIDYDEKFLTITGGEPTLLGDNLFNIINTCEKKLPKTGIHILSNGVKFSDTNFALKLLNIKHHYLTWAIPLYSDNQENHNYIVQSHDAFNKTIKGLYNLRKANQRIEIRVVLNRLNIQRLNELAYYIFRNLSFVNHIALMGLEPMGFGKLNIKDLWIDPVDYANLLEDAVYFLSNRGLNVSVYNTPLCTMPRSLWKYCKQSISDWKNNFPQICENCAAIEDCAGFFTSAGNKWISRGIKSIDQSSYLGLKN